MIRRLAFAVFLLVTSLVGSGCGIVNHQVARAANLLRVPVRMSDTEKNAAEKSSLLKIGLPFEAGAN
jgi:hypothetical protein